MAPRHFIDICDFDSATLRELLALARELKGGKRQLKPLPPATVLALMFDKPRLF